MFGRTFTAWAGIVIAVASSGCATIEPSSARDVRFSEATGGKLVTQAELQQDLERFAGQLMESTTEAAAPLLSNGNSGLRTLAMQQVLVYASSSLEIATGSSPELGLLDMLVFAGLSSAVLERYWIPDVFGEEGRPLLTAFDEKKTKLWEIAGKVMDQEKQDEIHGLIEDWLARNPDRVRVEAVRFYDFTSIAGRQSQQRAKETSGLFGSVRSATQAADSAVLLADRGVFLAQRMPFLLRWQTRLGAAEVLGDSFDRLNQVEAMLSKVPDVKPLLSDLSSLAKQTTAAAAQTRRAVDALKPLVDALPPQEELQRTIGSADRLTEKTLSALGQLNELLPKDPQKAAERLSALESRADHFLRRAVVYLMVLGAVWAFLFWGGFYVFRRLTADRSVGGPPAASDSRRDPPAPPPG